MLLFHRKFSNSVILLPLIQELIDKVQGAKYFTKLDIQWGYNNVRIREGDEWKAAFQTNRDLFEPLVMYFGMCNSPATFQLMMDTLFCELIMSGKIIIYMDDNRDQREFDLETRVITNENIMDLQDVSQLCTKQVGTGEIIKYKRELK